MKYKINDLVSYKHEETDQEAIGYIRSYTVDEEGTTYKAECMGIEHSIKEESILQKYVLAIERKKKEK